MYLVHGKGYASVSAMMERANELTAWNAKLGLSDGRVTELNALLAEITQQTEADRERERRSFKAELLAKAERDLRYAGDDFAEHRIEFEQKGRRIVRYYVTEKGFLKALIRMWRNEADFVVINVD